LPGSGVPANLAINQPLTVALCALCQYTIGMGAQWKQAGRVANAM